MMMTEWLLWVKMIMAGMTGQEVPYDEIVDAPAKSLAIFEVVTWLVMISAPFPVDRSSRCRHPFSLGLGVLGEDAFHFGIRRRILSVDESHEVVMLLHMSATNENPDGLGFGEL